jgi:GDPmannose 4,6-dehydratase/GDP-4-dehydro-6-deoxy-D-mannose reductase
MAQAPRSPFRRALITGISGSGGSYLAEYIAERHPAVEIHGLSRWHSTAAAGNLARVADRVRLHECDLRDFSSVLAALRAAEPDVVFHLASHANVRASFTTPLAVLDNNVMGTANLLEALRAAGQDPVLQLCSTSEVYGQVLPHEVPITEEQPLRPASPYAASKVAQDLLGLVYHKSYGMRIVRTRMFAYLNPRRADLFATSFARQVARIEAGLQRELVHGNLDSVRTLIDVRDAMEAYWVAAERCEPGEAYNIGGDTTISVGEFLELLKRHARVPIPTRQDPALLRPADVTLQVPDVSKFTNATGWRPRCDFESSVAHLLEHCRSRLA